tara:strand:+ start:13 stop:564 length:552 start_codon:yes stop_codon:yes gene_type:complete
MDTKGLIRNKFLAKRKKNYFEINESFFKPLVKIVKKIDQKNKIYVSLYYPSNFEVNVLKILSISSFRNFNFLLPIIDQNNSMNFYKWKKNDILFLNKYGIPEPSKTNKIVPNIVLVPLISFDKHKNRIGYGKGFYDKFLNKYLKTHKKILTVGVAFSFQKYHKLPVKNKDYKLDYIITEKGII